MYQLKSLDFCGYKWKKRGGAGIAGVPDVVEK